jgi:hypothetical protein
VRTVVIYGVEWRDAGGRVVLLDDSFTDPGATHQPRSPYGPPSGCYPLTPHAGTRRVVAIPDDWQLDQLATPHRLVRGEGGPDTGLTADGVRRQAECGAAGFRLTGDNPDPADAGWTHTEQAGRVPARPCSVSSGAGGAEATHVA